MEALKASEAGEAEGARAGLRAARDLLPRDRPDRVSSGLHKLAKAYRVLGDLPLAVETAKESLLALHRSLMGTISGSSITT